MKHLTHLLLLIALLGPSIANGQPGSGERLEALRTAFYTNELELTTAEAQQFWPVFNEYQAKLDSIQRERGGLFRETRPGMKALTDKELEAIILEAFRLEQAELNLKLEYFKEFQKVLPMQKVGKLYHAERKFRMMLLREFRDRRQGDGGPQKPQR